MTHLKRVVAAGASAHRLGKQLEAGEAFEIRLCVLKHKNKHITYARMSCQDLRGTYSVHSRAACNWSAVVQPPASVVDLSGVSVHSYLRAAFCRPLFIVG